MILLTACFSLCFNLEFNGRWSLVTRYIRKEGFMGSMSFLSFGELQASTSQINDILTDSGRIIVTNDGKPAAFMIAIDESSLEETLNDWQQVRAARSLRKMQKHAERNGLAEMTLDEINTEITASRSDDWPAPTDEQLERMYTLCRGCLEGMTQEKFDQLRTERIMGVK